MNTISIGRITRINMSSFLAFLLASCLLRVQNQRGSGFASSFSLHPAIPLRLATSGPSSWQIISKLYVSTTPIFEETPATENRSRIHKFGRRKRAEPPNSVLMKFTGMKRVETPAIALPDDVAALNEYFSNPEYRALLFPDNDAKILGRTITNDMFTTWCNEAKAGGASGPAVKANINAMTRRKTLELYDTENEKVEVMKITASLNMPSLEVRSESTIGVKLILDDQSNFPELQFTLLDSQLILEGSKAAKWIFNQLMKYRDSTSSFTRVTVKKSGEKDIVFTTDARLGINIRIPSAVLKLLPSTVNVEKFEEQGSQSVQKLLERDLEPALISFRDQFEACVNEKSSTMPPLVLPS